MTEIEMTGTEKQVVWASNLRAKFIAEMNEFSEGDRSDFRVNFSHLVDALHDFNVNTELTYAITDMAEENSEIAQRIIPQVREMGERWAVSVTSADKWIEIARNPFRGFIAENHSKIAAVIVASVQSNFVGGAA